MSVINNLIEEVKIILLQILTLYVIASWFEYCLRLWDQIYHGSW